MAIKTPRRIGAPAAMSLYDRIGSHVLNVRYWRAGADRTEREYARLIVTRGDNILSVDMTGGAKLIYGFESQRAFLDLFPEMFEELLPKLRKIPGADSVRFRLTHSPARPVIEPVLKRLWFAPSRDWLGFTLAKGARLPSVTLAGVRFRAATEGDVAHLARIDDEAFPNSPMLAEALRDRLRDARNECVVALRGKEIAGFYLVERPQDGIGWISIIAVAGAHRGEGIGRALTIRAAKRLFALGAREASLTTDEDNAAAIRLYVGLGFRQDGAGRDYTRPTDPKRIEQMRERGQGTLIRFGGWR